MPSNSNSASCPDENGLIENIFRFSHLLRDNGVTVSLTAVMDALHGLALIDIGNYHEFKCLLQVNLVCRREDISVFNKLFNKFWFASGRPDRLSAAKKVEDFYPDDDSQTGEIRRTKQLRPPAGEVPFAEQQWSIRYSPDALDKTVVGEEIHYTESRDVYEIIKRMLRPLNNRLSRRYHYTIRGKQISLRRILRRNMQFGGELIFLDFKRKKLKKRRVIFLCDISGSMDRYTNIILQFIHALKRIDRRTEIFFFSTDLTRATDQIGLSEFTDAVARIPELISDWSGGTRIGHCLQLFNNSYGQQILSKKDIVIIFSDGWDRGEIDELDSQMANLKRKSHKILWLNPLMGTRGYQPICQGMRTALPYVDYFLPMGALHDLRMLNRTLTGLLI